MSPQLSFEYFPPKTDDGKARLYNVHEELRMLAPTFCSVTYGAGGSTRTNTLDVVMHLNSLGVAVAPHLSFGTDDASVIYELLGTYRNAGICRIVALRGDVQSGVSNTAQPVYAQKLVEFIREHFGNHFDVSVAAYPEVHPQATDLATDVSCLKRKLDAGANRALTQFFYNPDAYFYFIDACAKAGITTPIIPGIMPILNWRNLVRFASNCGADIPRWLRYRLESLENDEAGFRAFCRDFLARFCQTLLAGGAPGLHVYTMNQAAPTLALCNDLGFATKAAA